MKYIRPPKGEYSERTLAVTKELGYTNVMWTFGYLDYDENVQKGTEYAKKIVLDNLHNGEIMLLHGNSKDNVNELIKDDNISLEEIKYIQSKLSTKVNEIEDLTKITSQTLSEVTHYTSVAVGPRAEEQKIQEIKSKSY